MRAHHPFPEGGPKPGANMIFLTELAIAILVAVVPLAVLHAHLGRILTDECGTVERADFWVRYTYLVVGGCSILFAALGTHQGEPAITVDVLRYAFTRSLVGTLAALVGVGFQIMKFLPTRE